MPIQLPPHIKDSQLVMMLRPLLPALEGLLLVLLALLASTLPLVRDGMNLHFQPADPPVGFRVYWDVQTIAAYITRMLVHFHWPLFLFLSVVPLALRFIACRRAAVAAVVLGVFFWFLSTLTAEYLTAMKPLLDEVKNFREVVGFGSIYIPDTIYIGRDFLLIAIPLLAALAAGRGRFCFARYAGAWIGCTAGLLFVVFAPLRSVSSNGEWIEGPWGRPQFIPLLAAFAYALAFAWLPGQRRALERLGVLANGDHEDQAAPPRTGSIWAAVALGVFLGAGLLASIGLTFHEAHFIRSIISADGGPRNPALVDAHDALAPLYTRRSSPLLDSVFNDLPRIGPDDQDPKRLLYEIHMQNKPVTDLHRQARELVMPAIAEYVEAWKLAAQADYLQFSSLEAPATMSYLNVREIARLMVADGRVRLADGDVAGALETAEEIGRLGALMSEDRSAYLVQVMIGVAVRGLALDLLEEAYEVTNADSEGRLLLREMLARNRDAFRQEMPWYVLRRTEIGFQPLVSFPYLAVGSFLRATDITNRNWARFELLEMAAALDAYEADEGAYPSELAALVPGYLPRLPRNPATGEDFFYDPSAPSEQAPFTLMIAPPSSELGKSLASPDSFRPAAAFLTREEGQ